MRTTGDTRSRTTLTETYERLPAEQNVRARTVRAFTKSSIPTKTSPLFRGHISEADPLLQPMRPRLRCNPRMGYAAAVSILGHSRE